MKKLRFADYLKEYLEMNNISNKDFANRIDITPKHFIDILSGNACLSTPIIENISLVTGIPIDYIYRLEANYKLEVTIETFLEKNNLTQSTFLKKFQYQYLIQHQWIDFIDSTDKMEIIKDILKFLRVNHPQKIYEIEQNVFYKSKNDKPELLLLWLEKCYRQAVKQNVERYHKENIECLVKNIQALAKNNIFDEKQLINMFNKFGIALVIQEDIPSSKIRGAFRVNKDLPSIYLTYKHKRIADIYFALLHELAHCKRNYNQAKAASVISLENEEETYADKQALNWMIDNKNYEMIKKSQNIDAFPNPKCFIAYRLAHDKIISYSSDFYQKYNPIIKR